jgi:hypothetical protein
MREELLIALCLDGEEMGVVIIMQFLVRSTLNYLTLGQNDDLVGRKCLT